MVNISRLPCYPKGDLRRLLAVIAAIDAAGEASLTDIEKATGLNRKTIFDLIEKAKEQANLTIAKEGYYYRIVDWGVVINPEGARMAYTGQL